MSPPEMKTPDPKASTGIAGLDDVLAGGFTRRRLFLVEGVPGSGKTTLALQYCDGGRKTRASRCSTSRCRKPRRNSAPVAESHGWVLDGIHIRELTPPENELESRRAEHDVSPVRGRAGVDTKLILDDVERLKPTRVVFDSLSELRLLAGSPLRYRRQILALKQYFATGNAPSSCSTT